MIFGQVWSLEGRIKRLREERPIKPWAKTELKYLENRLEIKYKEIMAESYDEPDPVFVHDFKEVNERDKVQLQLEQEAVV